MEWKKKGFKIALKMDLGRSWAPFGRGLGRSWASSGRFLPSFGRFLAVQNRNFFKHWPKMGSNTPSGSILARFGRDLTGFWEGFREVWGGSWEDFGPFEEVLVRFWKCLA